MTVGVRTRWPARAVRLLMLLLGIVATPSVGLEGKQRPHCTQHELAARHETHLLASAPLAHSQSQATWTQPHDHSCPHCPAAECARVSPCAGSGSNALTSPLAVIRDLQARRVGVDLDREHAPSAVSPPDTPPPQPIA